MKSGSTEGAGGANGRWVYDEQQDVTTTASGESEADLGQMNSFTFIYTAHSILGRWMIRVLWMPVMGGVKRRSARGGVQAERDAPSFSSQCHPDGRRQGQAKN